ncbi:MAG: endonuclease/exonuclease/phosphatase family protein [Saprospiraceae bacterium]|nr:endonuclease/exonuclease/phosphatase family protein [Saprospiraceae bacterium]
MFQKTLSHQFTHLLVTTSVALGVFICVFPQVFPLLSWAVNYAVQLMLLLLVGGLFFLFSKQPRLTFICFGGCLILSFHLKFSTKNNSIDRWRNAILEEYEPEKKIPTSVKVAQFNLANILEPAEMAKVFREANADVISIHEVTPGWSQWLDDSLHQAYPYHHTMVDLGLFGMAIYSRTPLTSVDTFYYEEIPNLRACFQADGQDMCIVSVHTEPALNEFSKRRLVGHLETISAQISRMEGMALVVAGDFNAVSWSTELQKFMEQTGLHQSRTGFMDIQRTIGYVPIDHIFHSHRLGCADFANFSDKSGQHLGIMATFQINPMATHVKKTAQ